MSGSSEGFKAGADATAYDEILPVRTGQEVRHASSKMPWWNPRYWRKSIWAGVILSFAVVLIIIIAVSVMKVKENRYPDYSPLSYSLADTCKFITHSQQLLLTIDQMEERTSLISSTTLQDTTPPKASFITFHENRHSLLT